VAGRASGIKMGDDGGGLLIGPDGVAPSWMVNVCLCYLPLHHKSPEEFLLALAHPGGPGKSGVKRLCVLFWKENLWDRWQFLPGGCCPCHQTNNV